jgi:hypothetical protein
MKSGSIWSQIPSQKTSPGGLSFVYQTIIAPHTGQSSQLFEFNNKTAQFSAQMARHVTMVDPLMSRIPKLAKY